MRVYTVHNIPILLSSSSSSSLGLGREHLERLQANLHWASATDSDPCKELCMGHPQQTRPSA